MFLPPTWSERGKWVQFHSFHKKMFSHAHIVSSLAIGLSIFHLLTATILLVDTIVLVSCDLMVAMILVFLIYPTTKNPRWYIRVFDLFLCGLAIVIGMYIIFEFENIAYRIGTPTKLDVVLGALAITLTIEATRRVMGWVLPVIAIFFLVYAYFGRHFPGMLTHTGFSLSRIIYHMYTGHQGLYGVVLTVVSAIIFLFVIFSAFIENSMVGDFFIRFATSVAGRLIGGPAKVAVISSSIIASITGAGVANVMATGSFTIPLMKRLGYKPHVAGGIEAAASTGGQFMPPIMGATAFVMTQLAGIPYRDIMIAAFLPAILYFIGVYSYVHLTSVKSNLGRVPKEDIPPLGKTLKQGSHLIIPLVLLAFLIFIGRPLSEAGIYGIVSVLVVTSFRKKTRMNVRNITAALETGAKNCLMLICAGACAGIVLGIVSLTGIGLKLSTMMISISGGNLLLAILLVMLVSLIFGMGLPVVACYIIEIVFAGPALIHLGLPILAAHMIVFWYSVDANVTPPVAIAAYAAAGIARSNVMKTAWESWRAAKALYVIPLLMAYTPLLSGTFFERLEIAASAAIGLICLTASLQGYMTQKLTWGYRSALVVAGIMLLWPDHSIPFKHLVGFLIFLISYIIQKKNTGRSSHDALTAVI